MYAMWRCFESRTGASSCGRGVFSFCHGGQDTRMCARKFGERIVMAGLVS